MIEYVKQACPLCDHPAQYYLVDHGNRKYFRCPECKDFQVYINAEEMLNATPALWKENASRASRDSEHEKILYITFRIDPKSNEKTLVGEFHDRNSVPK